jgi:F0F1-type ATP synthase gamma subunit
LKLTYNTARQAAITREFLEIVGRAEALERIEKKVFQIFKK